MAEIPQAAITAAAAAIEREVMAGRDYSTVADEDEALARAALEAAAPVLAEDLRAHIDRDHGVMVQLGIIADAARVHGLVPVGPRLPDLRTDPGPVLNGGPSRATPPERREGTGPALG